MKCSLAHFFKCLFYEELSFFYEAKPLCTFYIHIIKCKDEKSNMDRVVLALWGRLGECRL